MSESKETDKIRISTCVCGQLEYQVIGDPIRVSICHCWVSFYPLIYLSLLHLIIMISIFRIVKSVLEVFLVNKVDSNLKMLNM